MTELAPRNPEQVAGVSENSGLEAGPGNRSHETESIKPSVAEAQRQVMQSLPIVAPAPQPTVDDTTPMPTSTKTAPLIASDDDLIEKEWVDKLKRIIALTKDDPYERNRVIAQFQADYLKKRYNKTLGQPED